MILKVNDTPVRSLLSSPANFLNFFAMSYDTPDNYRVSRMTLFSIGVFLSNFGRSVFVVGFCSYFIHVGDISHGTYKH